MKSLKKNTNAVCDAINTLNNIILNFIAKISDEPLEKRKRKDITKDSG